MRRGLGADGEKVRADAGAGGRGGAGHGGGRGGLSGERLRTAEASVKGHPPVVTLLPFGVDPSLDYDGWLGHAVRPPRRE